MPDGLVYDRPSFTWVTPEEHARRTAEREERAFQRRARQGELCAPMVISDAQGGVRGLQSQVDGKFYDSKSNMRRHYKREGMVEVGNDNVTTRFWHGDKPLKDPHAERKQMDAIGKAFNRVGLPTT